MAKDLIYYFDKVTFERKVLGEIQCDFNMGLVIDGTKDSVTILVHSFVDYEMEPQTIIWHEKTNTWWVVSHDKVEKYCNDSGYYYIHNLDLLGAIELLNARDLTDCGFNDNNYNVGQFFTRLIKLSTFEFSFYFSVTTSTDLLAKNVDYVKTFENYTLFSAIREFLDSYNCCAKLTFSMTQIGDKVYIDSAEFDIIQKTGNANLESHDIDYFDEIKEIKTIDKNSFGACVVSNCENVISSQPKTYPSNGVIGLSSNEYEVKLNQNDNVDNTLLRLPSNVYKVNWLKLIAIKVGITIELGEQGALQRYVFYPLPYNSDIVAIEMMNEIINGEDRGIYHDYLLGLISQAQYEYVRDNVEEIWRKAKEYHTITFYDGVIYNPDDTFTKPSSVPYIPIFSPSVTGTNQQIAIFPKQIRDCLKPVGGYLLGIYWERGSNIIRGFNFLDRNHRVNWQYTDGYYNDGSNNAVIYSDEIAGIYIYGRAVQQEPDQYLNFVYKHYSDTDREPALFQVNYIPMSDIKMKVDNQHNKLDIQLYNQNGKLVDNVALERLVNSYAKEISSDNITRYKRSYNFSDMPKVGSFVFKGKDTYVINNVSLTFYQNETSLTGNNFGYYIEGEFTMSKSISVKSLMVNPNQNIRDYLIPQQYNVKRKQLYRDYWELAYSVFDDSSYIPLYVPLENILTFNHEYTELENYSTMIEIEYYEPIGGNSPATASKYWYYQLDCITIACGKQIIVICDFNDNNIIGYSSMNRQYMFDLQNLFNQNSMINTPISYVDTNGKFKGITLLFLSKEQRTNVDQAYYDSVSYSAPYDALLTQCFIPDSLYDIAFLGNHTFHIIEEEYEKDATEVPVFEYCAQVSDSVDVLIGDNALSQHENCIYFYTYVKGHNLTQNNVFDNQLVINAQGYYSLTNGVELTYDTISNNHVLKVSISNFQRYNPNTNEFDNPTPQNIEKDYDYAIFRHSYNLETGDDLVELMFIAKKVPQDNIENGDLILYQNHYLLR